MILCVRSYPEGPRVWVVNQRVHHGATGMVLTLGLLHRRTRPLALMGLMLAAHDRHDWKIWFVRECLPEEAGEILDSLGAIP